MTRRYRPLPTRPIRLVASDGPDASWLAHVDADAHDDGEPARVERTTTLQTYGAVEIFGASPRLAPVIPALDACTGRPTLIYALPGVGKSIALGSAMLAAASARPWLGREPKAPMCVLWLDGEVGRTLTRSRLQRLARGMGITTHDLADRVQVSSYPDLALDDRDAEARLTEACDEVGLLVIDSLSALSGSADENAPETGRLMLMLARVSDRTGVAVVVLHHSRRDGAMRGSTSIAGGAECIWRMTRRASGDIVLRHERSPIGELRPDLVIRIRDVDVDGVELAGLIVERRDETPAAAAERTVEADVLDHLQEHGAHEGGADALASAIGRRASAVRDALDRLAKAGAIHRRRAGKNTRIEVAS